MTRSRSFGIYYLRRFNSLCQEADPSIDLPQAALAVLIVGVFTAISVARSPRHYLHHGRPILGEQKFALIFQALDSAWGDVVFAVIRHLGSSAFGLLVNPFRTLRPSLRDLSLIGVYRY